MNTHQSISIPLSTLSQFVPVENDQRLGQQMYEFLKLDKLQDEENKIWANRLWESDGEVTKIMIAKVIDYNN